MGFKENLKHYREGIGITAKDFARLVGVRYTTYVNYENVGTEPKYETLIKIASALHVSIDELLGYKSDNIAPNVDVCQKMGLQVKVDKDGIHIFDEKKQPLGTVKATMFNLLVPHLMEESAVSASMYFKVLLSLYLSSATTVRSGLAKKDIQIDDKTLFEFLKGTMGNKFIQGFLLNEDSKDSEFAKYVQKAMEQEEAEAKK